MNIIYMITAIIIILMNVTINIIIVVLFTSTSSFPGELHVEDVRFGIQVFRTICISISKVIIPMGISMR